VGRVSRTMKLVETDISGAWVIESGVFRDHRGAFSRLYCSRELQSAVGSRTIVQINQSKTCSIGAVRGLHYQRPPHAEMKIVRCLRGRVFDVGVDLRRGSLTFLKWVSVELTPDSGLAFVIPEGCAHGFQVLEENSELLYLHTASYEPAAEGAVRFDDPRIGIQWPLAATELSARDLDHSYLKKDFEGIDL
jgi:dTDP-4-dehydrorhamnose 3,5-epimerase